MLEKNIRDEKNNQAISIDKSGGGESKTALNRFHPWESVHAKKYNNHCEKNYLIENKD